MLATYRDCRIKATEEEIAASLLGNWRDEHLFALKQALGAFDFCGSQAADLGMQLCAARRARLNTPIPINHLECVS